MRVVGVLYDAKRDLFQPVRRWVLLFPEGNHKLQAEVDLVGSIESGVLGPHTKECLCNAPYEIFNISRVD